MKIQFVGHSHHRVTLSSRFFTRILERAGEVGYHWDDTWRGSEPEDLSPLIENADLIVVWQSVAYIKRLVRLQPRNLVYVPMYDASRTLRRSFWSELANAKVLNFSSTLHQRVQQCGVRRSAYFQYFPNPDDHPPVADFGSLRGFFWQRQPRPAWEDIRPLLGPAGFDSFRLHLAPDPGVRATAPPSPDQRRELNLEVSSWFPDQAQLLEKLRESNIYFAPRLDEGIGLSFLEAMAMGMAVCAHDRPTHNEYIVDRVNGFLYDLGQSNPPDWSAASEIGRRARSTVEKGHARWQADQDRLLAFLTETGDSPGARRFARSFNPATLRFNQEEERAGNIDGTAVDSGCRPKVTIATVVRNAANDLTATLDSIIGQSYPDKEIIVIDGASTDATVSVIESYGSRIDHWCSEPDEGPYDAMNKAAALARGRWIIYINAGDSFVDRDALSRCLAGVPEDADFVAAHHVYIASDGTEAIHHCVDFEHSYRRLLGGDTTGEWLAGIPGHQATLTRVDLIREHRYDPSFRIAADHEFMYRMRRAGAVFHIEPVILSQYQGGGLSWQNLFGCLKEWRAIALRYTERPQRVERCFRRLQIDMLRMTRRMGAFDWRREPARKYPLLAAAVTIEFHARAMLSQLDRLYAHAIQR